MEGTCQIFIRKVMFFSTSEYGVPCEIFLSDIFVILTQ